MNPLDPSSFSLRQVKLAGGRTYQICDQEPEGYKHGATPVILLIHGFPDFWYEWRYQIGPLVRKGYRVIAPDMLGCGGTDKPEDLAAYLPTNLAAEMIALLTAVEIEQPVVVAAHDWGSATAWTFAKRYREKTRALISISTPYVAPLPMAITIPQLVAFAGADKFGYWLFFSSPDGGNKIQAKSKAKAIDLWREGCIEKVYSGEIKLDGPSDILSEKERQFYIETLEKGGIYAPLKYYECMHLRYDVEQELKLPDPVLPATMPILLIAPDHEPFAAPEYIEATKQFVPSQEVVRLDSAHFVMIEKKDEVTKIMVNWIEEKIQETA